MSNDPEHLISAAADVNGRFRDEQSPSEIVVSVEHAGRPEHTPDVEDVLLRLEPDALILTRLDGERFVLDRTELESFLGRVA